MLFMAMTMMKTKMVKDVNCNYDGAQRPFDARRQDQNDKVDGCDNDAHGKKNSLKDNRHFFSLTDANIW